MQRAVDRRLPQPLYENKWFVIDQAEVLRDDPRSLQFSTDAVHDIE
jgi:hypothetical protein